MKKFLLLSGGGIGDLIFALPVAAALKDRYSGCKVTLLVRGTNKTSRILNEILRCLKFRFIDNVYYYNFSDVINNIILLVKLKYSGFDYALLLRYDTQPFSMWPLRISKLLKLDVVALSKYLPQDVYIKYPVDCREMCLHYVDIYFEVLKKFDITAEFEKNTYYFKLFDYEKLENILASSKYNFIQEKFVILCVAANPSRKKVGNKYIEKDIKSWPVENWIKLASKITENGCKVVLLGGVREEKIFMHYLKNVHIDIVNLIGKVRISESIALLSKASLIVGCDTGLMHCAASLKKPTIMLLGAMHPKHVRGYGDKGRYVFLNKDCSSCYGTGRDFECEKNVCMTEISADYVYSIIKNIVE